VCGAEVARLPIEPSWVWTASWEKAEAAWADGWSWASAWEAMAVNHRFISPPAFDEGGSDGATIVTATWTSGVAPTGPALPQGPGCYAAWDKASHPWQAPAQAGSEHSGESDDYQGVLKPW
jgi:hypothetical protein